MKPECGCMARRGGEKIGKACPCWFPPLVNPPLLRPAPWWSAVYPLLLRLRGQSFVCCSYSGCCLEGGTITNPKVPTLTVAWMVVASAEEEGREPKRDHREERRAGKGKFRLEEREGETWREEGLSSCVSLKPPPSCCCRSSSHPRRFTWY